jgi:hypothetical protein
MTEFDRLFREFENMVYDPTTPTIDLLSARQDLLDYVRDLESDYMDLTSNQGVRVSHDRS